MLSKTANMLDKTAIMRYHVADYINVSPESEETIELMGVFNTIDENPQAQVKEVHYTGQKTSTTKTIAYKPQFPISGDMYMNEKTIEFLRDIAEEQKIGIETDYYRVRLYQHIEGKDNTYYARKFRVSIEISSLKGNGGEQMTIDGNLNSVSDVVIGEFNTITRVFTTKTESEESTI